MPTIQRPTARAELDAAIDSHAAEVFVARQPIFDADLNIHAYELLFRSGPTQRAIFSDGDEATTQTLLTSLLDIGLDYLVGRRPAFVNVTRSYLTGAKPLPVPKRGVVLEILETETIDRELVDGVAELCSQGRQFAMDDVADQNRIWPLLDYVQYVKLEYPALSEEEIRSTCKLCRRHNLKVLAEKIETLEDFERCRGLGIDYFQGYFFAKPQLVKGRRIGDNQLRLLQLLASLQNPDISFEKLESLIRDDVSMSYKLLKYINSAAFGVRQEVRSLRQALTLLGLQNLRSLAMLLALASVDARPEELLITAIVRARACESLAETHGLDKEAAYTVGLFSLLDAMLGQPMNEVLEHLPLSHEVHGALVEQEGALGALLALVTANESGDHETLAAYPGLSQVFNKAYVDAVHWACVSEPLLHAKN